MKPGRRNWINKRFSAIIIALLLLCSFSPGPVRGQQADSNIEMSDEAPDGGTDGIVSGSAEETDDVSSEEADESVDESDTEEADESDGEEPDESSAEEPEIPDIDDEEPVELLPDIALSRALGTVYGKYTVTHIIDGSEDYTINESGGVYEVTGDGGSAIIVYNADCVLILTGITRTHALTRLQITGSSNVILYLVRDTVNTFDSRSGGSTNLNQMQAGIYVAPGAALTIEGPGSLNAYGGLFSAGIGGIRTSNLMPSQPTASGSITINGGTVVAVSGAAAAGIGGGLFGKGGTVVINGGHVTATGGYNKDTEYFGGAGIGGGGTGAVNGGNNPNSSGNITINGGTVVAKSMNNGAGIGGGRNGHADKITINGGDITATTTNGGAGIGGGGTSHCGTVNITNGSVYARGSLNAAGIGNGINTDGGIINISGGIIDAKSGSDTTSGVGGGTGGKTTVRITGGSVLSANSKNMIRVNTDPTNGPDYGSKRVYMTVVELSDENKKLLRDTAVSINVTNTLKDSPYTYLAKTNADGKAYIWVPNGTYTYLLHNPDNGTYSDGSVNVSVPTSTVEYPPNTNTFPMQVASTSPQWSLTESAGGSTVYGSTFLNLSISHNNIPTGIDNRAVRSVKWYRTGVGDTTYTQETFDSGYAAAANKGEGGAGQALDLIGTNGPHEFEYSMSITQNGRYWIQIHYTGANTGKSIYHAAYIDVNNIKPLLREYRVYQGSSFIGLRNSMADAVALCTQENTLYTITATMNDADIASGLDAPIIIPAKKKIMLTSNGTAPYTIKMMGAARHFQVLGELTLENIVLEGKGLSAGPNANGGVNVSGEYGKLIMNDGAVIRNCYDRPDGGGGGGVLVSGAFEMRGGRISGNTAPGNGGGVHVRDNGVFTMTGGTISGNTAAGSGGGVFVHNSGRFTMGSDGTGTKNPEISGNKATYGSGGGIHTAAYANLTVFPNAVFGKSNTSTENTASSSVDLEEKPGLSEDEFEYFTMNGNNIHSAFGQYYSTAANHPVNNYDINYIKHTVTVNFVDKDDEPVGTPGSEQHDVVSNFPFPLSGTQIQIPEDITGCIFTDWKEELTGIPKGDTIVALDSVTADTNIYLICALASNLTISKEVTGAYGNITKEFTFKVYFYKDSTGIESFDGITSFSTVDGSGNIENTLMLDDGAVTFKLRHGESITIQDIPLGCWIDIQEIDLLHDSYEVTCVSGHGPVVMSHVDGIARLQVRQQISGDQFFHFTNACILIPITGISSGHSGAVLFLLSVTVLLYILLLPVIKAALCRRRRMS